MDGKGEWPRYVCTDRSTVPGLKAGDRSEVQSDWMQGKVLVIVATISFGMGVDKANVRWDETIVTFSFFVVNFQLL